MTALEQLISAISPADRAAMARARARWDAVAKPLGSLGLLEDAVVRAAGVLGSEHVRWGKKAVAVFCADNGVVAEGVTQTGQEVTAAVAAAMARGESCVCRMARVAGAQVFPVDMGMAAPVEVSGILRRSVRRRTGDIARGPAMGRGEAVSALLAGAELAGELARQGFGLLAAGEMGIGNTTTAAAVAAVLLGLPPERAAGRGAGLSDAALEHKIEVIRRAIARNEPDPADPLDVLAKVGGLDIAGMAGFYLGAAANGVPVLLDGAISCAAALLCVRLCPDAEKAMIASHRPAEPCGALLLEALGLRPILDAGLRLGEGTGAVAAMPALDMALAVYQGMSTFQELGIAPYTPQ